MDCVAETGMRALRLAALLSFCLIAVGCSAAIDQPLPSSAMQVRGPVPPPPGYMDFCRRHGDQCGLRAKALLAAGTLVWNSGNAIASGGRNVQPGAVHSSGDPKRYNWAMIFGAARLASESIRQHLAMATGQPDADRDAPVLSAAVWHTLQDVNQQVNAQVRQRSDIDNYGVEDYWEMPLESGKDSGDCEDFVLEKRKELIDKGLPMNALSIALVETEHGDPHAVLLVETNEGDYVLDNLSPYILPWKDVHYTWLERQSSWDPDVWVWGSQKQLSEVTASERPGAD
jgi:predicted transglutaminase-like cysteine proteinase